MPEQWTAEIIGEMHLNGIKAKQLAAQLGYNPKYVSAILNGHRSPQKAEQAFRKSLKELVQQKQVG